MGIRRSTHLCALIRITDMDGSLPLKHCVPSTLHLVQMNVLRASWIGFRHYPARVTSTNVLQACSACPLCHCDSYVTSSDVLLRGVHMSITFWHVLVVAEWNSLLLLLLLLLSK